MNGSKGKLFIIKGPKQQAKYREIPEEGGEILLTFEEALAKYLDPMYSTAVRLTKDPEKAKDLVQETCIRALKNFAQLGAGMKAKAWLFKILMNTFINDYRRKVKEPPIIDIDISELFDHSILDGYHTHPSPEEYLLQKVKGHEITEALNNLQVDFRTVVWLSDVEGFSTDEISQMTGVPTGTVASRLYRGRRLLRETLKEYAKREV